MTSIEKPRSIAKGEGGFSLVFVLIVTGMMLSLASGLAEIVYRDTAVGNADQRASRNLFAAEAGMNRGMAEMRNIFIDLREPAASDTLPRTFTFAERSVRYQLSALAGNPSRTRIPTGQPYAGLDSIDYRYNVFSDALGPTSLAEARVGARFIVHNIPLFQFVAFFDGDLEILPGVNMDLHGRIHTNGNLYLNSDATLTISDAPPEFTNVHVSAKGSIRRGRKNNTACSGTVTIDRLVDADNDQSLDPLELPCAGGTRPLVEPPEQASWNGSLISAVAEIRAPDSGAFLPSGDATYWKNADLRIVLELTQDNDYGAPFPANRKMIEIEQQDGTRDVAKTALLRQFMQDRPGKLFYNDIPRMPLIPTAQAQSTDPICGPIHGQDCATGHRRYIPRFLDANHVYRPADDGNVSALWNDLDYRRGGFWNNREQKWMVLLNLDVEELLAWNLIQGASNRFFDPDDASGGGLVIFLTVRGPDSGSVGGVGIKNNYGVRVFDSADIPFNTTANADPTGLSIVSDQAVYVQGDYNSVNKDPAAFMGDTVNVLSQNWEAQGSNDRKSRLTLASRPASPTTINAAFLGGADVTVPGVSYSGGLENFPRFHESWGSANPLTYRGSFVSLDIPRHVNGLWCGTGGSTIAGLPILLIGCNIYDAPRRLWDYDRSFEQVARLPPLTPRFLFAEQQSFTQQFR